MKTSFIVFVLGFFFLISCKKDVYDININYTGNWVGKDGKYNYQFNIDENSYGTFKMLIDEQVEKEHKGILRKEEEKLVMNRLYTFIVIDEPTKLDTGITFMLHNYEYPVTWIMKVKTPKSWGGSEITYYK